MTDFKRLMPDLLQSLTPYESPRDGAKEKTVWLNTNEYPEATVYAMHFESLNRNPAFFASATRLTRASRHNRFW